MPPYPWEPTLRAGAGALRPLADDKASVVAGPLRLTEHQAAAGRKLL